MLVTNKLYSKLSHEIEAANQEHLLSWNPVSHQNLAHPLSVKWNRYVNRTTCYVENTVLVRTSYTYIPLHLPPTMLPTKTSKMY